MVRAERCKADRFGFEMAEVVEAQLSSLPGVAPWPTIADINIGRMCNSSAEHAQAIALDDCLGCVFA